MSEPVPLAAGTVVAGKLRVVRLLGMGGMGAVYEVEHQFTKHRRALKLLHASMLAHPIVVTRFLREASAAGHIGNAHIVETFDAGRLDSGEPYIVMEMLVGETLAARIERQKQMPLGELVEVVRQACDGVQAAHDAGIVHRDLKPDNLFLVERDGKAFVKILDFGISKFDPALTGAQGTTKEGSALGTPFYMSPEQVDGDKDLDARTDVYALGVILYEGISGTRPFRADALPKLAVLIHEGKPRSLAEACPDLPSAFVETVHKAMARDRDQRFATVRELADALAPFGGVALDATMPETTLHRESRSTAPPASARSENPPGTPGGVGRTMGGSSLSVADTRRRKGATGRVVAGVAAAAVLLGGGVFVVTARNAPPPATTATGPGSRPPIEMTAEPSATLPPLAPVALSPLPAPTVAAVPEAGIAPSVRAALPTKAPPRASASTRAAQKGLAGDNPFQ